MLDSIEAISERSLATLSSLMSGDDSESYYKTMEVIIVQSIIKSVLDSIEAISERSLATLSSLMSGDDSESHYKTMEVIMVQSIIKSSVGFY